MSDPVRETAGMTKEVQIQIPRELAFALEKLNSQKNVQKIIARSLTPCFDVSAMPNQPSPDKVILSLRITRALKRRIQKAASQSCSILTDWIVGALTAQTQNVTLTADDYRKIADETEKAAKGLGSDQRLRSSRTGSGD